MVPTLRPSSRATRTWKALGSTLASRRSGTSMIRRHSAQLATPSSISGFGTGIASRDIAIARVELSNR